MSQTPARAAAPASPSTFARFLPPLALLALMWVIEFADMLLPGRFEVLGIRAWDFTHLPGVVLAPLLHSTWGHLIANSVPFLVLGLLVAAEGTRRFWTVTAVVTLVGGVGPWLLAFPGTLTVGASGLVFGYFTYLIARVRNARPGGARVLQIVIAVLVVCLYGGSMLMGILPVSPGVSWQGHLFGAVGGVCAALLPGSRRSQISRTAQSSLRARSS
ncbi:rhomboid family intramembrane serine protease [Brevibacterium album]|uniref:rhomboid family intramembrane serine protease n=1 Tax=Brevibacterium album TaxID=417948 RepID=UPI00040438D6|nr:rhomboid family intramembrane serine protease [Brevibacterium album]